MCDLILNSQELFTIGWDENQAGTLKSSFVDERLSKNDKKRVKDNPSTRKRTAPQNSRTKKQQPAAPPNNPNVKKTTTAATPLAKRKTCPEFLLDDGRPTTRSSAAAAAKKWAAPETPPFLKHILASYDLDFQRIVSEEENFGVEDQKSDKITSKTTPIRPRPVDFTILLKKPTSRIDLCPSDKDQSTSAASFSFKNQAPPLKSANDRKPALKTGQSRTTNQKIDQSKNVKSELDDDDDSVFDHSSFLATIDKMAEEAAAKKSKSRLSDRNGVESKKSHSTDQRCKGQNDHDLDDDDGLFERSSFLARLKHVEKTQKMKSSQQVTCSSKNFLINDNFTQISTPLDASTPISACRRRSARVTGQLPKQRLILEEDSQEEIVISRKSNPTSVEF